MNPCPREELEGRGGRVVGGDVLTASLGVKKKKIESEVEIVERIQSRSGVISTSVSASRSIKGQSLRSVQTTDTPQTPGGSTRVDRKNILGL